MRKYTIIATIWIILILMTKESFLITASCAIIHILCLIGEELQCLTKVKEENNRALLRTLNSIGLDLMQTVKESKS